MKIKLILVSLSGFLELARPRQLGHNSDHNNELIIIPFIFIVGH